MLRDPELEPRWGGTTRSIRERKDFFFEKKKQAASV
jgi:hypothetical protein